MKQTDKLMKLLNDKDVKKVFTAIKEVYGFTFDELCSREKTYKIAEARQMAMFILHLRIKLNATDTGRILNRNHVTVCLGANTMKDRLEYDRQLQERLYKLGYGLKPKKSRTISQDIDDVFKRIEKEYGYTLDDLRSQTRSRLLSEARQVACYLLITNVKIKPMEINELLDKGNSYAYSSVGVIINALPYDRVLQRRLKKMGYDI